PWSNAAALLHHAIPLPALQRLSISQYHRLPGILLRGLHTPPEAQAERLGPRLETHADPQRARLDRGIRPRRANASCTLWCISHARSMSPTTQLPRQKLLLQPLQSLQWSSQKFPGPE